MVRKVICVGVSICMIMGLTGCDLLGSSNNGSTVNVQSEITQSPQVTEQASVQENTTTEEPSILKFVDVYGNEYETEIISEVPKHNYDYSFLKNDSNFYSYNDTNSGVTAKIGIDVSKYQGDIDWNKVKEDGIEFVIIRLGFRGYGQEGSLNLDARFKEYVEGATNAGIMVGVYFFSQAITTEEAVEEAEYVLDNIKEYNVTGPVVFDTEEIKNVDDARSFGVSGEVFTDCCVAFCDKIKEAGYTPMIYFNMLWQAFTLDITRLTVYEKWYADYEPQPQTPYDFSIWQYTETGKVNGIEGNVDINLWFQR